MSEYEERIKKIEEVYGIHMSVERTIAILTIARVQYSSFGALPEAIDTLIDAYHEQQQEINKLRVYKLDWDRLKTEIEEMKQSLNRRTDAELKNALTMVVDRMTEMENEDEQNIRCDVFK